MSFAEIMGRAFIVAGLIAIALCLGYVIYGVVQRRRFARRAHREYERRINIIRGRTE
jgi:hypothetical protein